MGEITWRISLKQWNSFRDSNPAVPGKKLTGIEERSTTQLPVGPQVWLHLWLHRQVTFVVFRWRRMALSRDRGRLAAQTKTP